MIATTTIKRCAWVVAAMVALWAALAVLLAGGIAEAQGLDNDDAVAVGSTLAGSDSQVHQAYTAAMSQQQQPVYEPATLWVVNPGDSLWAISHQRLGPNPTAEQIMNEVGRIYELNRGLIGDDPNLIFPGQELLLPEVYKPAVITPAVLPEPAPAAVPEGQVPELSSATANQLPETLMQEEQEVLEPINSELAAPSEQPASEEQAAAPTADEQVRRVPPWPQGSASESPEDSYQADYYARNRKLLVLAIIVLSVLAAVLMTWRLLARRSKTSSLSVVGGQVYVSIDGGREQFIARGAEGTVYVPEIKSGKQYEFRLYSDADRSRLLDTVTVTRSEEASLTATPNPVPAGMDKTTIIWSTGSGSEGQVYVSVVGGQEQFVAQGAEGYADTEIQPYATHEFRLYSGADRSRLLDTVAVTRTEKRATSKEAANHQDMQRRSLRGMQNKSEGAEQVDAYISATPNPLPASPGADTTKIIWSTGQRWSIADSPVEAEREPEPRRDEKAAASRSRLRKAPPRQPRVGERQRRAQ